MRVDKLLPIGSIVKVSDIPYEIMIIGYMGYVKADDNVETRDYLGCDANKGYNEDVILFNKSSIDNIIFMGYKNYKVLKDIETIDLFNETVKKSKNIDDLDSKIVSSFNYDTHSCLADDPSSILNDYLTDENDKN